MSFKRINPSEIKGNVFKMIRDDWMLITAGNSSNYNTMTASWGGLGFVWGKSVAQCYIRHSRYTFPLAENNEIMTLSFYDESYRDALNICGTKSGRDIDKAKETGLTPVSTECGKGVYFNEANLVLVCRKLYANDIVLDDMLDKPLFEEIYAQKDYHKMYIMEILQVLEKE